MQYIANTLVLFPSNIDYDVLFERAIIYIFESNKMGFMLFVLTEENIGIE